MLDANQTLVFSPHVDDEVLGCFSFLGKNTFVLYFGVENREYVSRAERLTELGKVADAIGFQKEVLDNVVNHYQVPDLISPMERAINNIKPVTVLLPEPSYNQDHRAVYDAGITATRPHDINWFVPNVLIYEQLHSVIWPHTQCSDPNYFVPVDINSKIATYQLYESQVRGHRSPDKLEALARLRGAHICVKYAEAYRVRRMVGH